MTMQDKNDKSISDKESSSGADLFDQLQHEFESLVSDKGMPKSTMPTDLTGTLMDQELESTPAMSPETTVEPLRFEPADFPDSGSKNHNEELQSSMDTFATGLDTSNPFENDDSVHADLSASNEQKNKGSSRFIALASAIVLTVVGGIYWLAAPGDKQTVESTVTQQQFDPNNIPNNIPDNDNKPSFSPPDTATGAATTVPSATSQTTVGTTPPPETETSTTASATQDIKQDSVKSVSKVQTETRKAAVQRAAMQKEKAMQLATKQADKKTRQTVAEQEAKKAGQRTTDPSSANQVAVIQPTTPLQEKSSTTGNMVTVSDQRGGWIIDLASVNSDKSARQHVARMRSMGVTSKVVQVNDKGRIYHHIRVDGFSSKQAAMKRRDTLVKLLGLRDATVEKL